MKRLFCAFCVFFFVPGLISAHSFDISSFVISLPISEYSATTLPLTWSVSIEEALTLKDEDYHEEDSSEGIDLSELQPLLASELWNHFRITLSNGTSCALVNDETVTLEQTDETILTYKTSLLCPERPEEFTVHTTSFIDRYPTQTNIVLVTQGDALLLHDELTAKKTSVTFNGNKNVNSSEHTPRVRVISIVGVLLFIGMLVLFFIRRRR